jgi:geranylgeranyl diphosphate synthase type I
MSSPAEQRELMGLGQAIDHWLPEIEADLREVVAPADDDLAAYYGMLRYHLGWLDETLQPSASRVGKRLRPLLCLLSCQAAGGDPRSAIPAASALELVHNFSLVHDDIQDQSQHRRGQRAVWDVWGAAHGINVGDGLFVLARHALHRLDDRFVPNRRRRAAAEALDQACLALCEGQYLDMAFESRLDVDLDQYLNMIGRKTAALLAASTQLGAIVATDDPQQRSSLHAFGESLGMAFQIQDDILGIWGDEAQTGKPAAIDLRDKKKTLPVVYALNQEDSPGAAQEMRALLLQDTALNARAIRHVLQILDRVQAREFSQALEEDYYRQALRELDEVGPPSATTQLTELAASLLQRST